MFGWFTRKNPFKIDEQAKEVAMLAAMPIHMNLMLCSSLDDFEERLSSPAVRGYLIGFMDGAAQAAGIGLNGDKQFFSYIVAGHLFFLKGHVDKPTEFALASLMLQGNPQFDASQRQGGEDYFAWMKDREKSPVGLLGYFHD